MNNLYICSKQNNSLMSQVNRNIVALTDRTLNSKVNNRINI